MMMLSSKNRHLQMNLEIKLKANWQAMLIIQLLNPKHNLFLIGNLLKIKHSKQERINRTCRSLTNFKFVSEPKNVAKNSQEAFDIAIKNLHTHSSATETHQYALKKSFDSDVHVCFRTRYFGQNSCLSTTSATSSKTIQTTFCSL